MKKKTIWLFVAIAFLIIFGVFYTVSPRLDPEDTKREELLKSLEKQISAYRSDDPNAYQILEELYSEKGNIYRHNEGYSKAYNCYNKALHYAQKNKNHRHMAKLAWYMIGFAAEQKKSTLVLELSKKYQKVIEQRYAGYYSQSLFYFYYWWGMAYLAENNLEAAQKIFNKGLKYFNSQIDYDYSEEKFMIYCALSQVYAYKQDFCKYEEYLGKAIKLLADVSIRLNNDIYYSLKSALMEIERTNPSHSITIGEAYRKLAECYSCKDPKNYKINMLKAIKMYPPASQQIAEIYFELGEFFYKNQKYYFDKCLSKLVGVKSNYAAKMLLKITFKEPYEYQDKSFHLLKLALKALPDSNKDPYVTTRILCRIADYYSEKKDWQKAAAYAQKSFEYAKKIGKIEFSFDFVLACYEYVDNFYEMQKDIKKRIKNAENAVALMENKKDDFYCLNEAYAMLGRIYKLAKRYSDAEKCYREIIKTFSNNPGRREYKSNLRQEINAYCEIGDLCLLQKVPKRAEVAFNKASNLLKRKTVEELAEWYFADVCFNIANGYYYLKKDKLAEKYYKKSLALLLSKKEHTQKTIAYVYYRIGQIALGQKKKQKAQDSFKKGLKFALTAYAKQKNKYGNNLTTGMRAADIGVFYDRLKQKEKALEFLQLAHQLLKKYGENQPELAERISRHIKKLQK